MWRELNRVVEPVTALPDPLPIGMLGCTQKLLLVPPESPVSSQVLTGLGCCPPLEILWSRARSHLPNTHYLETAVNPSVLRLVNPFAVPSCTWFPMKGDGVGAKTLSAAPLSAGEGRSCPFSQKIPVQANHGPWENPSPAVRDCRGLGQAMC